jgi:hypothetical protein
MLDQSTVKNMLSIFNTYLLKNPYSPDMEGLYNTCLDQLLAILMTSHDIYTTLYSV